jgi:amino acid permease
MAYLITGAVVWGVMQSIGEMGALVRHPSIPPFSSVAI